MLLPIKESLDNTLPSTSYTISRGTQLKNLPNGISATRSKDDAYEYIHVLNIKERHGQREMKREFTGVASAELSTELNIAHIQKVLKKTNFMRQYAGHSKMP